MVRAVTSSVDARVLAADAGFPAQLAHDEHPRAHLHELVGRLSQPQSLYSPAVYRYTSAS